VWGRKLSTGYALGLVNNGDAPATVTCDRACFAAMNVTGSGALRVRDVWAHADVPGGPFSARFSTVVAPHSAAMFRATPVRG
jgi:hypothetical protein